MSTDCDQTGAEGANSLDAHEIRTWLVQRIGSMLDVHVVDIDTSVPFADLGLTSAHGMRMAAELGEWLGVRIPIGTVFDYPTIDSMARFLSGDSDTSACDAGPSSEADDDIEEDLAELLLLLGDGGGCEPGLDNPEAEDGKEVAE
ncbi:acyl carrier protein [Gordonia amarae]|nr:acyl carrier protein [Gordonia amarae]